MNIEKGIRKICRNIEFGLVRIYYLYKRSHLKNNDWLDGYRQAVLDYHSIISKDEKN